MLIGVDVICVNGNSYKSENSSGKEAWT
jgi:hypothetical protein